MSALQEADFECVSDGGLELVLDPAGRDSRHSCRRHEVWNSNGEKLGARAVRPGRFKKMKRGGDVPAEAMHNFLDD